MRLAARPAQKVVGGLRGTTVLSVLAPRANQPLAKRALDAQVTSEGSQNAERTRSEHGPNTQLSVRGGNALHPHIVKSAVFTRN